MALSDDSKEFRSKLDIEVIVLKFIVTSSKKDWLISVFNPIDG